VPFASLGVREAGVAVAVLTAIGVALAVAVAVAVAAGVSVAVGTSTAGVRVGVTVWEFTPAVDASIATAATLTHTSPIAAIIVFRIDISLLASRPAWEERHWRGDDP
jgi:hypothetical protein